MSTEIASAMTETIAEMAESLLAVSRKVDHIMSLIEQRHYEAYCAFCIERTLPDRSADDS